MNRWALVDFSWLCYRAFHTIRELAHDDLETGIIFGFFNQLYAIASDRRINTNQIALFFDSRKSLRAKAYPEYKANRKDKELSPEEIHEIRMMRQQMKLLREEILPPIGFEIHRQTGLESDDLMAMAAKQFHGDNNLAIIITGDHDLFQCISDNVHWYDPGRDSYHDPATFFQKYSISPEQFAEVKAMAGCHSDNVKGIPGVGEQTAISYLLGQLPRKYKKYQSIVAEEGQEIIKRNRGLVRLPHPRTNPITLTPPVYNEEAFWDVCKRFGIESYFKDKRGRGWNLFFKGILDRQRTAARGARHGHGSRKGLFI